MDGKSVIEVSNSWLSTRRALTQRRLDSRWSLQLQQKSALSIKQMLARSLPANLERSEACVFDENVLRYRKTLRRSNCQAWHLGLTVCSESAAWCGLLCCAQLCKRIAKEGPYCSLGTFCWQQGQQMTESFRLRSSFVAADPCL